MNSWLKRLVIVVAALPLLFVLLVVGYMSMPNVNDLLSQQEFDRERWQSWEETEKDLFLRWHMVDDLTDEYNLVGMKRSDVIELLGKPESEYGSSLYYYLGLTGHGINSGSLLLDFNRHGVVVRYQVWQG